jgi:hypothetical protein
VFSRAVRRPESHDQIKKKVGSESSKSKSTSEKCTETITFDLLLVHLEGFACLLGLSPQVVDGGLLLLEGLAEIFTRNAVLDQFPVELRGFILPLLEGRLRPLERGTLMLEPTQRLFPRQALPLERSLGLGKSNMP